MFDCLVAVPAKSRRLQREIIGGVGNRQRNQLGDLVAYWLGHYVWAGLRLAW